MFLKIFLDKNAKMISAAVLPDLNYVGRRYMYHKTNPIK